MIASSEKKLKKNRERNVTLLHLAPSGFKHTKM